MGYRDRPIADSNENQAPFVLYALFMEAEVSNGRVTSHDRSHGTRGRA
jgi:hypothetical protein